MRRSQAHRIHRGVTLASAALGLALSLGLSLGVGVGGSGASIATTQAQAKKELLKLSDLPKGWTATGKITTGSGGLPNGTALASCVGVPASVVNLSPPNVSSPEFSYQSSIRSVTSSVSLYASSKQARSQFAAFTNAKMPGCLSALFNGPAKSQLNNSFGHGLTAGTITVTRLAKAAPKNSTAIALNFTVTGTDISTPGEIVIVFGINGSQGMVLTLTSVETAFPTSLAKHVSTVQLNRL